MEKTEKVRKSLKRITAAFVGSVAGLLSGIIWLFLLSPNGDPATYLVSEVITGICVGLAAGLAEFFFFSERIEARFALMLYSLGIGWGLGFFVALKWGLGYGVIIGSSWALSIGLPCEIVNYIKLWRIQSAKKAA